MPGEFAFAIQDPASHITLSSNKNPHLAWSDFPKETLSFAVTCHDPDVPSQGDNVNQEGKVVPASLARVDFYHWVLVNIPANIHSIEAGTHSSSITPKGKAASASPIGLAGINDYTAWFNGDTEMGGNYFGYDGPCPPWNDEIKHHYVFTVYALNVASLPLTGAFTGADALNAMKSHILDQASTTGIYSINTQVQL
ncbi:MAG: YbhB/YbcL family Raf kinase inhibitor-like protein [Polynucleobacter victoriensis]